MNIIYKKIGRKVKLVYDFHAEKEKNHGKFYKNVLPMDKISLASSAVDKLMKKDEEFQFLLECEGLWPVEFLISLCWSNKSKAINKKR